MTQPIRTIAAIAALALASSPVAGVAMAADLLQAPTGAQAQDPAAWTAVVSRSYAKQYSDVGCAVVPAAAATETTYDLGPTPAGAWMFAVVTSPQASRQYGPAELDGTHVPAGADTTLVIGCHGLPVPNAEFGVRSAAAGPVTADAPNATPPTPTLTPTATPSPAATPSPTVTPAVPGTVAAGIGGGVGGFAVLAAGVLAVAGLALRGRRVRNRRDH